MRWFLKLLNKRSRDYDPNQLKKNKAMKRFNDLASKTRRNDLRDIAQHLGYPRECSRWSEAAWADVESKAIELQTKH